MKELIKKLLATRGYRLQQIRDGVIDGDDIFMEIYKRSKPFTLLPKERAFSLYEAVKYIVWNGIQGDFVECGVLKGGAIMIMALTLQSLGAHERKIWLYDTFEGMKGQGPDDYYFEKPKEEYVLEPILGELSEVSHNVRSTDYKNFEFVKGMVEETLPNIRPEKIALLRLDTDWYYSTAAELKYLYPLVPEGGITIIDDYAAYAGAKKAVDEYFYGKALLNRIDHDSRLIVKI